MDKKKSDYIFNIGLKIPYILNLKLYKLYKHDLQGTFSFRFLLFNLFIGCYYGCGWSFTPYIRLCEIGLSIHMKRIIIDLNFGVSKLQYLRWLIDLTEKKLKIKE